MRKPRPVERAKTTVFEEGADCEKAGGTNLILDVRVESGYRVW